MHVIYLFLSSKIMLLSVIPLRAEEVASSTEPILDHLNLAEVVRHYP
jgi:hypothetical protein